MSTCFRLAPIRLVLGLVLLLLVVACASQGEEATPRPTYTPYPTFTPAPTPTPRPTYTPYPSPTGSAIDPTRTPSKPSEILEIGDEEFFLGRTLAAVEEGLALFDAGEYRAAIEAFKRAQRRHGKPSGVLENRIALAYAELGLHELSIDHYSAAITINDSAVDRVNRALAYYEIERCDLAIEDAKTALALEPESAPGYHSDVEANSILYLCYFFNDDMSAALQHVDAALSLAQEHSYSPAEIADISEARDLMLDN